MTTRISSKQSYSSQDVMEMVKAKWGNLTVVEMAKKLEISRQYLTDMLQGRRPPARRILKRLGLRRNRTVTVRDEFVKDVSTSASATPTTNTTTDEGRM